MHLNASNNENTVNTPRTKVPQMAKGKQTNKHAVQGFGNLYCAGYTFTYSLSKLSVSSPWPGPSPGLAAGTKPPLCVPALGSQPGTTLGRLHRGYDWGPLGKLKLGGSVGVGHLSGGGMTDGVCVGTFPRPACPLVKRAGALHICNADLPPRRLTLGKGASMAGTKQASADGKCHSHFDSWPPFFSRNSAFSSKKKKPSPLIVCFSHNLHSASGPPH